MEQMRLHELLPVSALIDERVPRADLRVAACRRGVSELRPAGGSQVFPLGTAEHLSAQIADERTEFADFCAEAPLAGKALNSRLFGPVREVLVRD